MAEEQADRHQLIHRFLGGPPLAVVGRLVLLSILVGVILAAIGLDRSVFPTILDLVRQCNDGLPGGGAEGARRAVSAFGPFSADIAASTFRQAVSAV